MKTVKEIINFFKKIIEKNDILNKKIKGVLLGRYVVYNRFQVISDIDILVITDDFSSDKIFQSLKKIENEESILKKQMDIKILEKRQTKNQSKSKCPFLF
ncbi:MAG: hypothetical protein ACTSUR_05640 [Candidatus Heimdallarchaeaceae archaeon]